VNALVRLLQLASPALPIGAYSYSQGLEWAVEAGGVRDADSARRWIGDVLANVQARGELPVLLRLCEAAFAGDRDTYVRWHAWFRASRETAELAAETQQMGGALAKLLADLDLVDGDARQALAASAPVTLPGAYAIAARALAIAPAEAAIGYAWSWLENQVLAAVKTVPLGQVAGQRMLLALGATLPDLVADAQSIGDDDVGSFAPGLALASTRHETQYTRLFRS
jgi:urease accessory protein